MPIAARHARRSVVTIALLALVSARCAQAPESPTAPSAVLSRGAAPQAGVPAPAVPLGTVNALGATQFLAFGDSITWGETSSFDGAFLFAPIPGTQYPAQVDNQLEGTFSTQDFTVVNEGNPGELAINAVSSGRFASAMATRRPQALLLLEGINDLNNNQSIPATVGALQQMVEIARLYNTTVFIATMFQTCPSTDPNTGVFRQNSWDKIVPFNNAVRSMAAGRQNVYLVDIYAAFGNNCDPNGGIGLLGGDGLHPKPSGYSVMATTFVGALRERLAVRGSFQ